MEYFDRKYKLTVGKPGQEGILITELQLVFSITKTNGKEPNVFTGDIYNLSDESRAFFIQDNQIKLEVAYGDQGYSTLFIGNLVNVRSTFNAPDIVTHFDAGDAYVKLRDGRTSRSFAPGVSVDSLIRACVADMGVAVGSFSNGQLGASKGLNRRYQKGYSIAGTSKSALDDITRGNNLIYMIQDGTITVLPIGDSSQESIILKDYSTGLIGSPEYINIDISNRPGVEKPKPTKDQSEEKKANQNAKKSVQKETFNGVRFKCLLDPEMRLSRRTRVESKFINNTISIQKIVHKGNFRGDEWHTECDGLI